jgi:hypothetical protein
MDRGIPTGEVLGELRDRQRRVLSSRDTKGRLTRHEAAQERAGRIATSLVTVEVTSDATLTY